VKELERVKILVEKGKGDYEIWKEVNIEEDTLAAKMIAL
jgi:hypothetical protein